MIIGLFIKKCDFRDNLEEFLKSLGHETKTFNAYIELYNEMFMNNSEFDLIIADISFQQSNQSLQQMIYHDEIWTPVIFYNDPYPEKDERVWYWLKQNVRALDLEKAEQPNYKYNLIFLKIDEFLKENYVEKFSDGEISLLRSGLSPTMMVLFNCFKDNIQKEVRGDEIVKYLMEKTTKKIKPQCVYTYISRLKTSLKNNASGFEIIRTSAQSYTMIRVE